MRGVFEGKEVEDNYCAWRCSLENGDHQDSFGGPIRPPIGQRQMPGTHRNPRSLIVTSAAQLDWLQLQALGDVSGLLNSVVCDQLEPRKPEEVPFLVPQPQDSTVRLYLMPRSISERAWVLCVCLSSDRRRPPREGPSLSRLHAHAHAADLMLHGLAG